MGKIRNQSRRHNYGPSSLQIIWTLASKEKNPALREKMNGLPPPYILKALGDFDLDPCAPIDRPWPVAKKHYTYLDNGLMLPWEGRVFCNPPYGKHLIHWLEKCAMHKNVIALTFARTETHAFHNFVWPCAKGMFFPRGRLKFFSADGQEGDAAGAPSVLIAYNDSNAQALKQLELKGKFIALNG